MSRFRFFILSVCLFLAVGVPCRGQRVAVSTNVVDWADLGTANIEAGVAVGRHFTVYAGVRYNPWTFRAGDPDDRVDDPLGDGERQFQNRKQAYGIGLRWWPWYVWSGWWVGMKAQYMEYDYGGFITHPREAGDDFGVGLSAGYTYMLSEHWNIDFGLGVWGGYKKYGAYRCTNCGMPVESGEKTFILPDEVKFSLMYVF